MGAYPHGPQCAPHLVDVTIKTPVAQHCATRREDRRRVGNTVGLMFEQVIELENGAEGLRSAKCSHGMGLSPLGITVFRHRPRREC